MQEETNVVIHKRTYKDRLFCHIFQDKEKLLSLYNAINGTTYTNPEYLEVNTLENAIYINMKNDISFIIGNELYLYEHQSTFNPNMPLRDLLYLARLIEKIIVDYSLYTSVLVKIPTPHFVMFYNGLKDEPEKSVLKLSDAFKTKVKEPEIELKVTMININHGKNEEIMEQCQILKEYSQYVQKVRVYIKDMDIEQAVERAVTESIEENILKEYLEKYKAEAIQMSIFEYDEEKEWKKMRKMEFEYGCQIGEEKGKLEGKAELVTIIQKKKAKNKSTFEIAEILEAEVEKIQPIVEAIERYPEMNSVEIATLVLGY